jgi:hypothetical protein
MSTLGDPLMDLALLLVYWEQPRDGLRHQVNVARNLTTDGFWSREQLIRSYSEANTRPLDHLQACLGLASTNSRWSWRALTTGTCPARPWIRSPRGWERLLPPCLSWAWPSPTGRDSLDSPPNPGYSPGILG